MRHAFLIARQEFIKYVTRRGFLLSILMFPLWIMIVIFIPKWTGGSGPKEEPVAHHYFTVVDRTGGAARDAILAPLTRGGRLIQGTPYGDYVAAPDWLAGADAAHFPAARQRAYEQLYETGYADNPPFLDTIVVVPPGFGREGRTAEIWTRYPLDAPFRRFLEAAVTRALRLAAIRQTAPGFADVDALDRTAALTAHEPAGAPRNDSLASIVPVALAIILFVISVMNSSVLLQGVVEEKSTRMIEVLLSCATPREITTGKLVGVIAVALTTLVIWALVLFALMALADRETVGLVFASLKAVASLDTLPLLLIFFLCGLLIYGSLFLAIGSMANSLADAQSLLGPSMLILMLPNLMLSGVIRDPNGVLASTLSWVPVYTPFFMMLRLASHPPAWQVWGTTALALATTALMIVWTGRVFARHVLTTERPPTLGALVGRLFGRPS
ncbi:MAG: ABC transporter permease [Rhizomicrobium sp.]